MSTIDAVNNTTEIAEEQRSSGGFFNDILDTTLGVFKGLSDFELRKLEIKTLGQQQFAAGAAVPVQTTAAQSSGGGMFGSIKPEYIFLGVAGLLSLIVVAKVIK
ncbi:hypothetical protein [Paremcibacter congregatus]|uniref:hypothetical protein n=1 Tax=Paremcibacter congregatus TaxID=2043170 RepID=UPI0030EB2785|tara:strand:- start:21632 stop:21943 length:312 start_codon:yes stop_codon:yes gene_type:complete